MIIDIRGTHGSGKSTCVHYLIKKYENKCYRDKTLDVHFHFMPEFNLIIVGKYRNQCGGADGVNGVDRIQAIIEKYDERGYNVLVEGILVSHTFERWHQFATGRNYVFVHLEPSVETCIKHVQKRRVESGKPPEFNTKNLEKDHRQISRTVAKLAAEGHDVRFLGARKEAWLYVEGLLKGEK